MLQTDIRASRGLGFGYRDIGESGKRPLCCSRHPDILITKS